MKMRGWRQKANNKDGVPIVKGAKVLRGEQSQAVSTYILCGTEAAGNLFSEFLLPQVHCLPPLIHISSRREILVIPP
jgi:hypothetical protein